MAVRACHPACCFGASGPASALREYAGGMQGQCPTTPSELFPLLVEPQDVGAWERTGRIVPDLE